jgi:predicted alpha/beta-fold hydrolase
MKVPLFPATGFRPPWLLRNQHVQTILGHLLRGPAFRQPTVKRLVTVSGGDRIVLHDAMPPGWQPGDRIAILVHGLGGSHDSGHPRRFAHLLDPRGVRTVRVDLRGCGDGLPLARSPPHSGRSDDVRAILHEVHSWSPSSPLLLVGVSLGANTVLKLAGEAAFEPVPGLERVAVLGPPADMRRCSQLMEQRRNRFYNRYFAGILVANALKRRHYFPDLPRVVFPRRTTLRVFDELYTAPLGGFADADDYYTRSSSAPLIPGIRVPTLILAARDDPFIAVEPLEELKLPPNVELRVLEHGGHLGFVGKDGAGGLRWAERRVVEWLLS